MSEDVSGAAAMGKARDIWLALCYIAYQEGIEVKSFDQKTVIEYCQDMEKMFRACKKARNKAAKERIKMVPLTTAKSEISDWVSAANYKQKNLTDFQTMQNNRKDVRWQKPFDITGSGYGGKAGTIKPEKFQQWMNACTYEALAPFWHLKGQMGGTNQNIQTWKQFCTFLLQTKEAKQWIRYYLCGVAAASRWAKDSTRGQKKNPSMTGDFVEPVIKLLVEHRIVNC